MKIFGYGRSDTGLKRTENEDTFFIDHKIGLYAVADGMGGHRCGSIASQYAIRLLEHYVKKHQDQLRSFSSKDSEAPDSVVIAYVEGCIRYVARGVQKYADEHPECKEMGTTLTALLALESRAVIGHVGDSRCYLVRGGSSVQLTDDHTVIAQLLQHGIVSKESSKRHMYRHVLSQSIGCDTPMHIDTLLFDVRVGDVLILSSDGVNDYLEDQERELGEFVMPGDPQKSVNALVDFANESGGKDNITVLVLEVTV